jgi:hypothetical protein
MTKAHQQAHQQAHERAPQLARFIRSTKAKEDAPCANCNTVYSGHYCPECGQEALGGAPTAIEFIYEFLTRNVLERGKMPRTLWHLIRYPGGLTVDFLEGRRQRFIRPVRLYIGLSLLYFLMLSLTSKFGTETETANLVAESANNHIAAESHNTGVSKKPEQAKSPPAPQLPGPTPSLKENSIQVNVTGEEDLSDFESETRVAMDFLGQTFGERTAQAISAKIQRFEKLPPEERIQATLQGLLAQAPKAMFFLMPVFAMLLKLLFIRRHIPYGAHLLFAFHYHAFLFLSSLLLLLPLYGLINFSIILVSCLYLPLALRTTYVIGWSGALWRCMILAMLYPVAIMLALLGTLAANFLL